MKEACGVFGVYAPGRPVAQLTFDGLYALQHRGQESAGMAVSDDETITVVKDMGLVATVFDERTLSGLTGHLAIGHTRYSTAGSSEWSNAQPVYRAVGREPLIKYQDTPVAIRDKYQYFTEAQVQRLRQAGYNKPFTTLEEGVTRYVTDYLSQPDPYK